MGALLVIVGRPFDAFVSILVIGTNIVVGIYQEMRAKQALDEIALLTRPTASVVRDGEVRTVGPEEIVVGDTLQCAHPDGVPFNSARPTSFYSIDAEARVSGAVMAHEIGDLGERAVGQHAQPLIGRRLPLHPQSGDPGPPVEVGVRRRLAPRRIVYVSCHPGTLARDAGVLVNEKGYRCESAGIIDMFPHTSHVESIAVFNK